MMPFPPLRIGNNFFILLTSTLKMALHWGYDPRFKGIILTNIYWIIQNEIQIYQNILINNQRKKGELYIDAKPLNNKATELENTNYNLSTLSIDCNTELTEKNSADVIRAGFACKTEAILSTIEFWNMENGAPKWQSQDIKNYSKLENNYIVVSVSNNRNSNYLLILPCRANLTCHDIFFEVFPLHSQCPLLTGLQMFCINVLSFHAKPTKRSSLQPALLCL